VSLYVATQGHNWSDKVGSSWLKTNTPCTWGGISCSGITPKHVSSIERSGQNLTGIIPNLSALTDLQNLYLSSNNLTGDLQGISDLNKLKQFKAESNKLTGSIPSLPNSLESLSLQNNALTGKIPDLTALSALNNADFGYNALVSAASDMTSIDSNWLATQTVPVTNVTSTVISATEVQISWTPIAYTDDGGYYTIGYGTSSGTYSSSVNTTNKTIASKNIAGLTTGTPYIIL